MVYTVLDLFCGAGGAAMGYHRAGFDVIGVDIEPQPNYPFPFFQADALEHLGESIDKFYPYNYVDVIHASPPCQRWSTKTADKEKHPDYITPLRNMLRAIRKETVYVIENVPQSPLEGITLCGSMFGLGVRRHRVFESNVLLSTPSCSHKQPKKYRLYDHGKWYMSSVVHVFGTGGGKGREHWQEAMGIDWTNDTDELREAIPPAYTEHIGIQLKEHLNGRR